MKRALFFLFTGLLLTSCGSLRVIPKGCKTKAYYASNPDVSREVTYEELEDQKNEITMTKELYVINDSEIKIKDLLQEKGLKCEDIKKLRVKISTFLFFSREVEIKAVKN